MTKKETPDYEAELIREYEHWEYMKEYGGSDPFYDDAGNMNLTRNHIILAKEFPESLEAKTFAVGMRVEHPREIIDKIQYKDNAKNMNAAEYRLTCQQEDRGVYSHYLLMLVISL